MDLKLPKYINLKEKTGVYIDAANMFYSQKSIGFKIDYQKLHKYLNHTFNITLISYYTGYDPQNSKQLKFLKKLEQFGYRVIKKPIKKIETKKKRIDKANVDVELAIDAIMERSFYKNIILASGDSDFGYLLKILKKDSKSIIVLSARGHISKELRHLAHRYVPLERLKNEIAGTKNHPRLLGGKLT